MWWTVDHTDLGRSYTQVITPRAVIAHFYGAERDVVVVTVGERQRGAPGAGAEYADLHGLQPPDFDGPGVAGIAVLQGFQERAAELLVRLNPGLHTSMVWRYARSGRSNAMTSRAGRLRAAIA